jgi:integrase
MKLTEAAIAKVKRAAIGKSEHIEWDEALPGFGLRIRDGRATWVAQYKIGAKHRRLTLGTTEMLTAEQARHGWSDQDGTKHDGAAQILLKARDGHDAAVSRAARRKEASSTLDGTIRAYLEARKDALRPRSYKASERHLKDCWKPLHNRTLVSINREAVATQVSAMAKTRGPVAANRARASLSAMFRWAIGEGLCDENPVFGTNKREENGPRERALTDAEAASVFLACPDNSYGRIVRLLMLTGCRRDEIGSLQWSEIDLDAKTITLPATRTKNSQAHVVPLCDAALKILQEIPHRDRPHVFGKGKGGFSGWAKSKRLLDAKLKLDHWTPHDLRRTVRTGLGMLGVAPHVAEAVLNHLPAKLIRTYDRNTYAAEKRDALERWASHLAVIVAQASGANVTALRKV